VTTASESQSISTARQPSDLLLSVEDLRIEFPDQEGRWRPVVDGVGLSVKRGESLALVGESGSGKTMTARSIIGLLPRSARLASGRIHLAGRDVSGLTERQWYKVRGRDVGMVFQDAMSGLNPVRKIGSHLTQSIVRHQDVSRGEARKIALETLGAVGIPAPRERIDNYPHQLSGGLRQRVMIALAIVNRPPVIIADEPTTALDATIQAQILELLTSLLDDSALLMITHDLGVAASIADQITVIYAGRMAEHGTTERVLEHPRHPYTAGLIRAVPRFDRTRQVLVPIPGAPPTATQIPPWCAFAPRCPNATEHCREEHPPFKEHDGRRIACWHPVGS
jgi:oligopeptide/dipeptide ABC transporter ATP-binding protein